MFGQVKEELVVQFLFLKASSFGMVEPNMLKVAGIQTMFVGNFWHVKLEAGAF